MGGGDGGEVVGGGGGCGKTKKVLFVEVSF